MCRSSDFNFKYPYFYSEKMNDYGIKLYSLRISLRIYSVRLYEVDKVI